MKTLFFLVAVALVQISGLNSAKAGDCPIFNGSYRFENNMAVTFDQKDCSKINVTWGSGRAPMYPQTFSLTTSEFTKDWSQGFGASIISYRYNIIGRTLVMSYKNDGSDRVSGYAFTRNKRGLIRVQSL